MRRLAVVVLASLAVVACGDDGDSNTTTPDTTSTSLATTTTSATELPGERVEIYPYEGAALAVVGVASDDTLNVRVGPGTDFDSGAFGRGQSFSATFDRPGEYAYFCAKHKSMRGTVNVRSAA